MELLEDRTLLSAPAEGNILFVKDGFPGTVFEYTAAGVPVQELDLGTIETGSSAHDLIIGADGKLHLFQNGATAGLRTYDFDTGTSTLTTIPGLSTIGNLAFGTIAAFREYVYLPDNDTGGNPEEGIVRVDTTDFSWERFPVPAESHSDLNVGLDGLLYAVRGESSPNGYIDVFDPITMERLRVVHAVHNPYAFSLVVDQDSNIYVGGLDGVQGGGTADINKYDASGNFVNRLTLPSGISDIDIRPSGEIVATDPGGMIYLTDTSLASFTSFAYPSAGAFVPKGFVAWAQPLPGPTSPGSANITLHDGVANEATGQIDFLVTLSEPVGVVVTVDFSTTNATAQAGANPGEGDFDAITNQQITFNPGQTQKTVSVTVNDDNVVELTEAFIASLSNLQSADANVRFGTTAPDDSATFYSVDIDADTLVTINSVSGVVQTVGLIGHDMNPATDLAFLDGKVYAITADDPDRFSLPNWDIIEIDPLSGAKISSQPITVAGTTPRIVDGLTSRDGKLLLIYDTLDATSSMLGEIDPATGEVIQYVDYEAVENFNFDFDGVGTHPDGRLIAVDTVGFSGNTKQIVMLELGESPYDAMYAGDYLESNASVADLTTDGINLYSLDDGRGELITLNPAQLNDRTNIRTTIPGGLSLYGLAASVATIDTSRAVGTIMNDDSATLSIDDVQMFEGDGGGNTEFIFTVTLDTAVDTGVELDFETAAGTAIGNGIDFSNNSGMLTFAGNAGESHTVTVQVKRDFSPESNEDFFVNLANIAAQLRDVEFANAQGTGTILDDDAPDAVLSVGSVNANESTGMLEFEVTLSAAVSQTVTVELSTVDGTATSGSGTGDGDFDAIANQVVTFLPGQTSHTVTVVVNNDSIVERDENFRVSLANISAGGLDVRFLPPGSGGLAKFYSVDIDADTLVTINPSTGEVQTIGAIGHDMNGTDLAFLNDSIYAVTPDSPDAFSFPNWDLVVIDPQTGTKTSVVPITVGGNPPIIVDGIAERDGKLLIMFDTLDSTSSMLGEIDPATGEVTFIIDYRALENFNYDFDGITVDRNGQIWAVDSQAFSGAQRHMVFLSLQEDPYSVSFAGDYLEFNASVADLASDGVDLYGLDDGRLEFLTLSPENPSQRIGITSLTPGDINLRGLTAIPFLYDNTLSVQGTILNDEFASISIDDVALEEGDGTGTTLFTFTVTLDANVDESFTVDYASLTDTAIGGGNDYQSVMGTLTFAGTAGETHTVTVAVNRDDFVEANETFFVDLAPIGHPGIGLSKPRGVGTIIDDDAPDAVVAVANRSVNEATGEITFDITLSAAVGETVTLEYSTVDGTAKSGAPGAGDYDAVSNQAVTFLPGETLKSFSISLNDDTTVELDEAFSISLSNIQAGSLDVRFDNVTLGFSSIFYSVNIETDELVSINPVTGEVQVVGPIGFDMNSTDMAYRNGTLYAVTADDPDIFSFPNWHLVAIDPETGGMISNVPVTVDGNQPNLVEGLTSRDGKLFIDFDTADLTASMFGELDGTTGVITPIVDFEQVTIFNYDFDGITARPDGRLLAVDSNRYSGSLTQIAFFEWGEDPFSVTFAGDFVESNAIVSDLTTNGVGLFALDSGRNEFLVLNPDSPAQRFEIVPLSLASPVLQGLAAATIVDVNTAVVQAAILNDDTAGISIDDVEMTEGSTGGTTVFTFHISLDAAVDVPLSVNFSATNGTATSGDADYTPQTGAVQFTGTAGETATVSIDVNADERFEPDETFFVELLRINAAGRDVQFVNTKGTGTIVNDDGAPSGVVEVTPAANNGSAAPSSNISATFDGPIDHATVNADSLVTHTQFVGQWQNGTVAFPPGGNTVTADPIGAYFAGELVQVTSTADIRGLSGARTTPFVWQFRAAVSNGSQGVFDDGGEQLGDGSFARPVFGDLDGDGDLDAIISSAADVPHGVWLNDGSGVFTFSGDSVGSLKAEKIALGDIDGDGDLDAFVVIHRTAKDEVWLNDGTGSFTNSGQALGRDGSQLSGRDVALGDVDGDGDLDAVVARSFGESNLLYLNNGSGVFTDSGQNLAGNRSFEVALGDVDGDGDLDVFLLESTTSGLPNLVLLNDGAGHFTDSGQRLGSSASRGLALGDLDGDGDLDAFVGNHNGQENRVWFNNGSGVFDTSAAIVGDTSESLQITLGDIDGDGDLDAVASNTSAAGIQVWTNDGSGSFTATSQAFADTQSTGVILVDVDGDRDLDIVAGGRVWLNRNLAPGRSEVTGPLSFVPDATPVITWSDTNLADSYDLLVYNVQLGRAMTNETGLSSTTFAMPGSLPAGVFQVFVRGVNSTGIAPWSRPFYFNVRNPIGTPTPGVAPTLTGPISSVNDTTPVLTWTDVVAQTSVDVLVYSITKGREVVHAIVAGQSYHEVADELAPDSYQAFVGVPNGFGGMNYSAPMYFNIERTEPPLLPAKFSSLPPSPTGSPTIEWQPITGANYYDVQLYDQNAGQLLFRQVDFRRSNFTPLTILQPGRYQFFVRGYNSVGEGGDWSGIGFDVVQSFSEEQNDAREELFNSELGSDADLEFALIEFDDAELDDLTESTAAVDEKDDTEETVQETGEATLDDVWCEWPLMEWCLGEVVCETA